jgi:hypothetical protein
MSKLLSVGMVFLFFTIQSCDPAHSLVVEASNLNNASVTIHTNSNIMGITGIGSVAGKTNIIVPDPSDTSDQFKKTFYYGLGTWYDSHLKDFASKIDSIVFVNEHRRMTISGTMNIYDYLRKHRSGMLKTKLKIKAN